MFGDKNRLIIAVHNDELIWLSNRREQSGKILLRLPLEDVLKGDDLSDRIPKSLIGNYRNLLIVPDHWFGAERYPFQSRKPGLIEPFLQRKLGTEFPGLKDLRHFISYRHGVVAGDEGGLTAYFLQDAKSFELYRALQKWHLTPRHITTFSFLWMETLAKVSPDFDDSGSLLVHMSGPECLLYFYFKGNYLFSRNVLMAENEDRLSALAFEINQSLYMFSQKTKSELSQLYLLDGSSDDLENLSQALGRDVIDFNTLLDRSNGMAIDELPLLDGLLHPKLFSKHPSFLTVSHREVRRELEWEPVQWAGIIIGLILLLPLLGENVLLSKKLREQTVGIQHLYLRQPAEDGVSLAEAGDKIDRILQSTEKIKPHDAVYRLLASLPETVRIQEIDMALEGRAEMNLTAVVFARDADHLKDILTRMGEGIRNYFDTARAFSINQVDIRTNDSPGRDQSAAYLISFRVNLS